MLAQTSATAYPLVSVLMPAYNACRYIDLAIESILNQSYQHFELIILDDGSTDDTFKRVQYWAASDMRVHPLINDKNRGLVYSLNRMLREASTMTKYFARMDSDDISLPERLAHQVEFLEANPEYGLVGGHNLIIDNDGNTIGVRRYPLLHEDILRVLTRFSPFSHPTVMFRKCVIETVGEYNEIFQGCEDYDLWMRIAINYRVENLNEITLKYRINQNQIKQKHLKTTIKYTLMIQKKWLLDSRLRSIVNIVHWCGLHLLLLLPNYFVLALFKKIVYSKTQTSSSNDC